ncbi:MAG: hypothetical protein C5B49_01040 [Bdellovibrio sp.]|nr:MAG: hypothetical protein C5B49_01040 [Bdellovibrio sp.]
MKIKASTASSALISVVHIGIILLILVNEYDSYLMAGFDGKRAIRSVSLVGIFLGFLILFIFRKTQRFHEILLHRRSGYLIGAFFLLCVLGVILIELN